MATNFHMFTHKTTESLHIKLTGDFDGSSAFELINTLTDNLNKYYQIFVNTTELNSVHPFGVAVLEGSWPEIRSKGPGVVFIGRNMGLSMN